MPALPKTARRFAPLMIACLPVGGMVGCVSQSAYDQLTEANRALTNRNIELTDELEEQRALISSLRGNQGAATATTADLRSQNQALRGQLADALAQIRALETRLADLPLGGLDPATDVALQRLAAQYPNLIQYDAERGMLRFASDLTFASGSAEVQPQAREALGALTQILQAPEAQEYEVIVVGHTDSQRLSSGTRQRFGSNRGLSTARAISVIEQLESRGVPGAKMQAAGWGEFRPLVANTPNGNTPQNRRVEIFLRPSTLSAGLPAPAPAPAPAGGSIGVDREQGPGRTFDATK